MDEGGVNPGMLLADGSIVVAAWVDLVTGDPVILAVTGEHPGQPYRLTGGGPEARFTSIATAAEQYAARAVTAVHADTEQFLAHLDRLDDPTISSERSGVTGPCTAPRAIPGRRRNAFIRDLNLSEGSGLTGGP